MLPRVFLSVLLCVVSGLAMPTLHAQAALFTKPAALEPAVNFWKRVYTEAGTNGGFIHDDTRLDVVYGSMEFPLNVNGATRSKRIDDEKRFVATTLRKLAAGNADELSKSEQRVRDAWPADTPRDQFRDAIDRVRFQLGQADRFKEGLIRSGAWRDEIKRVFKRQGLPEELAALPHVESSFNTYAYSRVGAAGMWQFMRSTGKRFLRIDNVVDERLDPYKASAAAANFMQQNYALVQSWPLAITAYNHGAGGMRRARDQLGTDDIGVIVQQYDSKSFGFASRNFYACFLAALEIDSDPQKYFPGIELKPADPSKLMPIKNYTAMPNLAKSLQIDTAVLKQLNPALMAAVWTGRKRIPSGFELRVPGTTDQLAALRDLPSAAQATTQLADQNHRVRNGETLSAIALKYGVSLQQLAQLNHLRKPYHVTVGKVLQLPGEMPAPVLASVESVVEQDEADVSPVAVARDEAAEPKTEGEAEALGPTLLPGVQAAASADPADYSVHKGIIQVEAAETLGHYADWLETTPSKLRSLNKLSVHTPVQLGRSLKLDFSQVSADKFAARRRAYHQQLQEAFFAQYRIVGTDMHSVKKGESIWVLSQKTYNVPVWLLRQYNPDLDLDEVRPGTKLVIPRVVASEG
jgi:membrane-bound lytic murein transglycosylase D